VSKTFQNTEFLTTSHETLEGFRNVKSEIANRAKVVTESQPTLARNLGHSRRVPYRYRSTTDTAQRHFFLYVNLRIMNHHQTSPNAWNVLLAFPDIVLGLCK